MLFDANLMFRTTGNLTQAESNGPLIVRGTPVEGLAAKVVIPAATIGAADTILARYYVSDDNSTYTLLATNEEGAVTVGATGRTLITPLVTPKKYIKEELIVTGTTTNFGAVVSGLIVNPGGKWSRAVDWS